MGSLTELNESNFEKEVLQAEGKIVVDFWAPWCGPCKMLTPVLEKVASSNEINAKIVKVNTDECPSIAQKYGIQSIPTLITFENGEEIDRNIGAMPEQALIEKLK